MIGVFPKWSLVAVASLVMAGGAVGLLAWTKVLAFGSLTPDPVELPNREEVACLGFVDVEGGVAALDSLRPGRVAAVLVKENERVAAGAALIRLEDRWFRERLEEARAALEVARLALEQAKRRPREHRLRLAQQAAALTAAQERTVAARQVLAFRRKLVEKKVEAPERLAEAAAHVAELEALAQAETDRLSELKLQNPVQDLQRAEAEVRLQTARTQQAEAELKELTLTAPGAGTVLRILAAPGDLVGGAGRRPVLYFCPSGRRVVRVEVEQDFVGALRAGQAAVVRDDSDAPTTWRGRILRVADWFGPHRVVLEEPRPEREVRTVECVIELEENCSLRIGQRVRVRIETAARRPE